MAATETFTGLSEQLNQFQNTIYTSVMHFRKGEDLLGLEAFLKSIGQLRNLLETDNNTNTLKWDFHSLLLSYGQIASAMSNLDVIALTDLLEFTVSPLTETWIKGCEAL